MPRPLNSHQVLHLQALISDAQEEGRLDVRNFVQNIVDTKEWPAGVNENAEIHDYVEKEIFGEN